MTQATQHRHHHCLFTGDTKNDVQVFCNTEIRDESGFQEAVNTSDCYHYIIKPELVPIYNLYLISLLLLYVMANPF